MSYFKSSIFGELFKTFRNLALIVHLTLVGVLLPTLANDLLEIFNDIATYDVLEAGGFIEMVVKFDENKVEDPLPDRFEDAGYDSRNAFTNMATVGVVLLLYVVRLLLLPIFFLI